MLQSTLVLAPLLFTWLVQAAPKAALAPTVTVFSRRAAISDPFYTPPTGFESTAQGTILGSRTIIPNPLLGAGVKGTQLLYRTTSLNNTPSYTVTTVLSPMNPVADVLFSYQNAEDSVAPQCAPSFMLGANDTSSPAYNPMDISIIATFLALNWTVAVPDYEGPLGSYGAGRIQGHGVLDGLAAAVAFPELNFSAATKLMAFGYSGGAIATGWAAALQPTYAPSLNVVGFSTGGTPGNFTADMIKIAGTSSALLLTSVFAGLMGAYPNLQSYMQSIQTPALATWFQAAETTCVAQVGVAYAGQSIFNTSYQPYGLDLIYQPAVVAVFEDNLMGRNATETPTAPMFVFQAVEDELIPVESVDAIVSQWCANGAKSLQYTHVTGNSSHGNTNVAWIPRLAQWLEGRVNGVPPVTGCTTTNISITDAAVNSSTASSPSAGSSTASAPASTGTKTGVAAPLAVSHGALLGLLALGLLVVA